MVEYQETEQALSAAEEIRFRLLGPLTVTSGPETLPLGGVRQHKLLAALLLNRDTVISFDRIVDVLWDVAPQSARQQMHNAVGALRRALAPISGDAELVTTTGGYRLATGAGRVDLALFRDLLRRSAEADAAEDAETAIALLSQGLRLWHGPALTGLDGQYFVNIAAQLNEQRMTATERLMELRLARGETRSLVGELVGLVAGNPFRESLRGSLMLALFRSGRQGEALAVYEEGRRLLAAELGLDPGPHLRSLQVRILNGQDHSPAQPAPVTVSPPPEPVPPVRVPAVRDRSRSFLPHTTVDFTGRTAEMRQVLAAVREASPSSLVISALDGMGGVGKTALAVQLSHQLADEYPDAQYFVDLHGFSVGADPVSPAQALEDLLWASGVPIEQIPADLEARSALWRSRLAGSRSLVLLDNAKDEAQVRPLLPGTAGPLVLITSRRRLTALEGATPLSLDVLPESDAVSLFVQVAGADRVGVEDCDLTEVVKLCGRLPLAIRVAAARYRDRHAWSLTDLLGQLRSHRRRLRFLAVGDRSVMTVLRLSYQYLSPADQALFRQLCLHPGADFDAPAAAALCGLPLEVAEQSLETLYEGSLLLQHEPGRYEFHDLLRDCSRSLLEEHDSEAGRRLATQRVLDYYLHMAVTLAGPSAIPPFRFTADPEYRPEVEVTAGSAEERTALLKANHHSLLAAAWHAIRQDWPEHAWRLPCALMPYLSQRNYGAEGFDLFAEAYRAARGLDSHHGQVAALGALAVISRDRGSSRTAQDYFHQALDMCAAAGDVEWQAYLSNDLGSALLNDGQVYAAQETFELAYTLARELGDDRLSAMTANNIGVVFRETGRYEPALAQFDLVVTHDVGTPTPRRRVSRMVNRAVVHHLLGRLTEAKDLFDEALTFSRDAGTAAGEATVLYGLSITHRSAGDVGAAVGFGRDCLALARRLGLAELECLACNALGEAFFTAGDLPAADAVFRQAEAAARARGLTLEAARAVEGLAHVSLAGADAAQAEVLWGQALAEYADGVAARGYAAGHLSALDDPAMTCLRCRVDPTVDFTPKLR